MRVADFFSTVDDLSTHQMRVRNAAAADDDVRDSVALTLFQHDQGPTRYEGQF
ncbi:hypothetical protein acdb102_22290 [Acidothermaceae bacterium B102]|nr:hypothetical protein acdb102_22290 [Acidothermaceae bacterium B102]